MTKYKFAYCVNTGGECKHLNNKLNVMNLNFKWLHSKHKLKIIFSFVEVSVLSAIIHNLNSSHSIYYLNLNLANLTYALGKNNINQPIYRVFLKEGRAFSAKWPNDVTFEICFLSSKLGI